MPYMVGYLFISHSIVRYFFFAALPFATDGDIVATRVEQARYPESVSACFGAALLVGAKVALGVAKVVYGIQQVGLAAAIGSGDAGYSMWKFKNSAAVVSELY